MEMSERIKRIRKELDITQREFADKLCIKQNTVATYEMGRTSPSDAILRSIMREFNVKKSFLIDGIGSSHEDIFENGRGSRCQELDDLMRKYNLSQMDYIFVEKLLSEPETRVSLENFCIDYAMSALGYHSGDNTSNIAALEAAYAETLNSASNTGSSASNTTEGRDLKKAQ